MGNVEREVPRSSVARHSSLELSPPTLVFWETLTLPVALYKGGSSQSSYVLLSLRLMGVLYSLHDGLIDTFKFLLNSSTYKVNIK